MDLIVDCGGLFCEKYILFYVENFGIMYRIITNAKELIIIKINMKMPNLKISYYNQLHDELLLSYISVYNYII